MLGFTENDVRLQKDVLDSFIKHQQPQFLSELQSIQLLGDAVSPARTTIANDLAVRNQLSVSQRFSKKCIDKASFVKRQYCSSLSRLKQRPMHKKCETTKLSHKSKLSSLFCLREMLILQFTV